MVQKFEIDTRDCELSAVRPRICLLSQLVPLPRCCGAFAALQWEQPNRMKTLLYVGHITRFIISLPIRRYHPFIELPLYKKSLAGSCHFIAYCHCYACS